MQEKGISIFETALVESLIGMNQCESILQEIHRSLSLTASRSSPPDPAEQQNLIGLVRNCLRICSSAATVQFLTSVQERLEGAHNVSEGVNRTMLLEMSEELSGLLETQRSQASASKASRGTSDLSRPVRYVKGVGERIAALLSKLDIHDEEDLLYFFPYRYEDRRNLVQISRLNENAFVTVQGIVRHVDLKTTRKRSFKILQVLLEDSSGTVMAKWFNQAYLRKVFKPGQQLILSGRVKRDPYSLTLDMENPEYEILQADDEETIHTNRIVPIYHTTAGLGQRRIRTIIFHFLESRGAGFGEFLPEELLKKYHLPLRSDTLMQLHFPGEDVPVDSFHNFRSPYHKRFIFEEFLLLEILLAMTKGDRTSRARGISFQINTETERKLVSSFPYTLTAAQQKVIREIKKDMGRPIQMSRLLQGDVGCGKTTVAALAAGIAMENGYQVAVMAPTEILAEQLYFNFHGFFDSLGKQTALLARVVKSKEREHLREQILHGDIDVVVGTQALIQKEITFHKLGLVIIDEQHRFGVIQRATLMQKGRTPDVLVMTATPIPRSLSLTVYGDLDISVIDEIPAGRSPVNTEIVRGRSKKKVYRKIDDEIEAGRQVYIVYPLVEETEKSDLAAATEMSDYLSQEVFPHWRLGLLHGRIKPEEKEKIMHAFKRRDIDILVSTTVIEVGIDIPNATVMAVEHAERFGLAQLHQLRGRVGRDRYPSYCYLMVSGRVTDEARRRLAVMERTNDGFKIAEEDLAIRGPGEFFGKRQSGMPDLIMANIIRDLRILEAARKEAFMRIEQDPRLEKPDNRSLVSEIQRRYKGRSGLIRVG
jgi:ATP-dependent DNA helicase RecG